jgi:uncharacterized RDD family membrane protein YckC
MALISCLECGNPVEETAAACSRCGRSPSAGPIQGYSHAPSLASIGQRTMARSIDVVIVLLAATVISFLLSGVTDFGGGGLGTSVVIVFVVVWIGYFTALESNGGRTPGKAVMGLQVTGTDHVTVLAPLDAFARNAVLVIPLLWLVALGGMAVDVVRRQGFHDKLVGTVVIFTG